MPSVSIQSAATSASANLVSPATVGFALTKMSAPMVYTTAISRTHNVSILQARTSAVALLVTKAITPAGALTKTNVPMVPLAVR